MTPADHMERAIRRRLAETERRPLVVGLCGPQGSGKSTLAAALVHRLPGTAVLSLDDLYLTRAERRALAAEVHPLFATRGVPGTHDTGLGHAVLDTLADGRAAPLPRFDKARDDRAPDADWPVAAAGTPVVILEGWCVGARAEAAAALARPVNSLEAAEDADGRWRDYANRALAGPYRALFDRIDLLALLAPVEGFACVADWRIEQERGLRATGASGPGVMDDAAVRRFVAHYERLTRHLLAEMPGRAELVFRLDAARRCVEVGGSAAG